MLRKFNFNSSKLNEILTRGKRDLGKGGIEYVYKGKTIIKSLTIFVKASNHEELGEFMLIRNIKKVMTFHKVICHDCGAPEYIRL